MYMHRPISVYLGYINQSFDTVRFLSRGTGRRTAGDSPRTKYATSSAGSKTSCRNMWQSHKPLRRNLPVLLHLLERVQKPLLYSF